MNFKNLFKRAMAYIGLIKPEIKVGSVGGTAIKVDTDDAAKVVEAAVAGDGAALKEAAKDLVVDAGRDILMEKLKAASDRARNGGDRNSQTIW